MRVSPIVLAIFIVLTLAGAVGAYFFYDQARINAESKGKVSEDIKSSQKSLDDQTAEIKALHDQIGFANLDELRAAAASTPGAKLEQLVQKDLDRRDALVKEIGVDITDVDAAGKSVYLESTIQSGLAAAGTPANLKGTLVGEIVDALRRANTASKENERTVADGRKQVDTLNQKVEAKRDEIKTTLADWDGKIKEAWDARALARQRLIDERPQWVAETASLTKEDKLTQGVLDKIENGKKAQTGLGTPADGKLLSFDWKSNQGVISLGSRDGIKPGYEFDVFERFPGPDTPDRRSYHGKVRVVEVKPEVSLVAVMPSEWDDAKNPIMAGDLVASALFDANPAKKFYVIGWFPPGSKYNRESLAGLIVQRGGQVQDELQLNTDYTIVGTISEEGMPDLSDEAKAAIAKAKADYDMAVRFNTTVLTVDKFLAFIKR